MEFRRVLFRSWARRSLPFYEVVDPSAVGADGNTVSSLRWDNYRADQSVATSGSTVRETVPPPAVAAAAPAPRVTPRKSPLVLLPDQFGDGIGADRRKPSHF